MAKASKVIEPLQDVRRVAQIARLGAPIGEAPIGLLQLPPSLSTSLGGGSSRRIDAIRALSIRSPFCSMKLIAYCTSIGLPLPFERALRCLPPHSEWQTSTLHGRPACHPTSATDRCGPPLHGNRWNPNSSLVFAEVPRQAASSPTIQCPTLSLGRAADFPAFSLTQPGQALSRRVAESHQSIPDPTEVKERGPRLRLPSSLCPVLYLDDVPFRIRSILEGYRSYSGQLSDRELSDSGTAVLEDGSCNRLDVVDREGHVREAGEIRSAARPPRQRGSRGGAPSPRPSVFADRRASGGSSRPFPTPRRGTEAAPLVRGSRPSRLPSARARGPTRLRQRGTRTRQVEGFSVLVPSSRARFVSSRVSETNV
jgi:hypothetical protein